MTGWALVNAQNAEIGAAPDAPWRITPELFEPGCVAVLLSQSDRTRSQILQQAAAAGVAAVCTVQPETDYPLTDLPVHAIPSSDPRRWFAELSCIGHGLDHRCPPLYAVTGTDGKTTTACIMQHLLGPGAGYIGTLGLGVDRQWQATGLTTPAVDVLHDFLSELPDNCPGVAVEASSIGLHQHRLGGLRFTSAVLTNVGSDHLDYHGSQAAYERCKRSLFAALMPGGTAVLPGDDPVCEMVQTEISDRRRAQRIFTVGRWQGNAQLAKVKDDSKSWQLTASGHTAGIQLPMPGEYNCRNAAQALLAVGGDDWSRLLPRLQEFPGVPGRLEEVAPRVFVDYAHTPQALHAVLTALRCHFVDRQLIVVAGCGGDRDVSKRPAMGAAMRLADIAYITTDNPRSESPSQIAEDMIRDLEPECIAWGNEDRPVRIVHDRGQAIRLAIQVAADDGVAVVCGKGHETRQILATGAIPWDDAEVIRKIMSVASKENETL